jgi:formylglycine-generating enzyme
LALRFDATHQAQTTHHHLRRMNLFGRKKADVTPDAAPAVPIDTPEQLALDFPEIELLDYREFIARPYAHTYEFYRHPKDGTLLVKIPSGKCLVGEPAFEVELPEYWLGVSAVTNEQYKKFVLETKHRAPDNTVWQEGGNALHPVTHVSCEDAMAYSGWAGLRLPSELEWEKGARGVDGRKYPWGAKWEAWNCRHDGNNGRERTSSVWSHAKGRSPWGTYNQSGNVWEWCADRYEDKAYTRYKRGDLKPPTSGPGRGCVIRGGGWSDVSTSSRVRRGGGWYYGDEFCRAAYRVYYDLGHHSDNLGFRLALSSVR